jgi:cbb3-type cytochrome oxidase subunit 3
MEPLEIIFVVAFSLIAVGSGAYLYRQRKKQPGMKQSASSDNLVIEDPQTAV